MEIIVVILVSLWTIGWICAWCKRSVEDSAISIRQITETLLKQQKVISCQEKVIAELRKKNKFPTVKDYHTHVFSTKN